MGVRVAACNRCHQPIVSGEGVGFVCFKVPGSQSYQFFHRRSGGEDCWEAYLTERTYMVDDKEKVEQWA